MDISAAQSAGTAIARTQEPERRLEESHALNQPHAGTHHQG